MSRQSSGHDEDRVDAQVVAGPEVARCEALGSDNHTAQSPCIERKRRSLFGRTCLDLDEGKGAAAARNDVDLAAGYAGSASEDAPAVEAQPPTGERLGTAAALFRRFSIHFERSSARV
jgi:hypothetical protein